MMLKLFDDQIHFQVTWNRISVDNLESPLDVPGPSIKHIRSGHIYPAPSVGSTPKAVPFFEGDDIVTNPPAPLKGVGLYYKASLGSGGTVAPLIYPHF